MGSACTAEGALAITRAGLPDMEVRCPIHGLIEYNDLEERVINCAVMQRLRYIHQLAMAYLVYPGAVHTRFDHSLGVMHVAGKMADALGFQGKKRQNIRLAALLHDVGHGPFSHVSEILVASAPGRSRWFHEVSDIFMGNPLRGQEQITVYLPLHGKTRGDRNAERRRLRRLVRDAINQREREGSQ